MSNGARAEKASWCREQVIDVQDRWSRILTFMISLVAIAAALAGLFLVAQSLSSTPLVGLNTEARGSTLSLWISNVDMLSHSHEDHNHEDEGDPAEGLSGQAAATDLAAQGNFTMPASMMPGTPDEGFQRLQLNLGFANKGSEAAQTGPEDFYLLADDGDIWQGLRGGSFNTTRLGSGQVLNTVLAFDVPESVEASNLELIWNASNTEIRFAVDSGPGHAHG